MLTLSFLPCMVIYFEKKRKIRKGNSISDNKRTISYHIISNIRNLLTHTIDKTYPLNNVNFFFFLKSKYRYKLQQ